MFPMLPRLLAALLFGVLSVAAAADDEAPMTNARIDELLSRLDADAVGSDGHWRLVLGERAVMVITDTRADRMRIIAPVTAADALEPDLLLRLMQANFDTALDARYAVARGTLWSAFIHPLSTLGDEAFLLGLGQVVNLANTFGSSYSSGVLMFGGGDSRGLREKELLEELVEKGLSI